MDPKESAAPLNKEPTSTFGRVSATVGQFFGRLTRTKLLDTDVLETNLCRCLTTTEITLLAIGHMVGSGVYVLSATVAKTMAGPGIVVAFLISGFASFLAALCYAELGVRYPRSGSAYSYTYLALGEMWAFLVGWNVALENVIGIAAVARSCSAYVDALVGGVIRNTTVTWVGTIHSGVFSDQLDFLALLIVVMFVAFLSFGVKITSILNSCFSVLNMVVIVIIIGVGAYFSDIKNWTNPETGGFLPYGFNGVLAASASCFYAYIGFDAVATSGEEARDPQKSIPRATMISMGTATVAYVGVSSVLTLMVSYKDIADNAGLPEALAHHGATWAKYVVICGAVCGMATALIGALFALTRVIYAMADDGLLFPLFSKVNERTKIPLWAMYIFSAMSAVMSLILDINTLVEVMSIGTLFAYLVVSASVIILRYRPGERVLGESQELSSMGSSGASGGEKSPDMIDDMSGQFRERFYVVGTFIKWGPGQLVTFCVFLLVLTLFLLCGFVKIFQSQLQAGSWWLMLILVILALAAASCVVIILMHQQSPTPLRYKVPFVPFVPALSIFTNIVLITNLKAATWVRLVVWVAIGMFLYFVYGFGHSKLNLRTLSPKSSLLGSSFSGAPTWGSVENKMTVSPSAAESSVPPPQYSPPIEKTSITDMHRGPAPSSSQEILVTAEERSP